MKTVTLIQFQMLIASTVQVVVPKTKERTLCLLKYQFYHAASERCFDPFDSSPCGPNQWLAPTAIPGDVTCQPIPSEISPECNSLTILENGDIQCQDKILRLNQDYRKSNCQEGQIRLPENFIENTTPCPEMFICRKDYQSHYSFIKTKYFDQGQQELGKQMRQFWGTMLCSGNVRDKSSKMVCVPTKGSLDDNKMMIQSFKPPKSSCQVNPCPRGTWPWQSEDGYQRCLLASEEEVNDCFGQIVETEGKLQCQIFQEHFTNLARNKCPRGRIYRRGRCIPRFFG